MILSDETLSRIRWDERGLVAAIVQDASTLQVLTLAYMNRESLQRTLEIGETVFWSRSRQELWHKGATSGNTQTVREIRVDCDADAILLLVEPAGPACHTGAETCFYRTISERRIRWTMSEPMDMLRALEALIARRKADPKAESYTNRLFDAGVGKISQKVGEEAVEVIVAALNQTRERQISELADLFYHTLVLMTQLGITLEDVEAELRERHKPE